jgi:CPA2 family monovalent cation:H+ antiporter-2
MEPHALMFIEDLAVIMLVAGFISLICHYCKQPLVFGYILAGIIIGPHTPPVELINDKEIIHTLAALGVILLLFSLGLEFNFRKLLKVGGTAFIAACAEILLMIALGYKLGLMFHWPHMDAIFLGCILAISSTTIIVKALTELGLKQELFAQLIFGILIIEDIFAILILVTLTTLADSGSVHIGHIFFSATQLIGFLTLALVVGSYLIPRLLNYLLKSMNEETILITILGLCFGFCLLVIKLNYSVALGAFLVGAMIGEVEQLHRIERLIAPIRDMFSAIFFVSVGLMFDPSVMITYALPLAIIVLVVVVGKVTTASIGVLLSGRDGETALHVGMGLAQIGEFSFIIASLGTSLQVTDSYLYSIAVAVSVITTLLTPYLIKSAPYVSHGASRMMPKPIKSFFHAYSLWLNSFASRSHTISVKRNKEIKK